MTLNQILKDAIKELQSNNIEDAEFDAREILLKLIDIDMANFLSKADEEMEKFFDKNDISEILTNFEQMIQYRKAHYPLQYILGETYFCGLRFNVDENVLIPRFDTEVLVEKVLSDNMDRNKTVLDMCTGSGCIAISLAELGGFKNIVASDISMQALKVASDNADELINNHNIEDEMNQHIYFVQSDMFNDLIKVKEQTGIEKFDIITCNPPYIKTDVIETLSEEVRKFEPKIALDGDKDGLKYYKNIAKNAKDYLTQKGKIYLEIGYDQADEVRKIFEKEKYKSIDIIKDLSGNDRVAIITL